MDLEQEAAVVIVLCLFGHDCLEVLVQFGDDFVKLLLFESFGRYELELWRQERVLLTKL